MKTLPATLTSQEQITIPVEVRRHLGVAKGDKIGFIMEDDGTVRLRPERYSTIDSLAGAAGSLDHPLSWEEVQTIARDHHISAKHA